MRILFSLIFSLLFFSSYCQETESNKTFEYDFLVKDSPAQLFTMRQVNQNYLSFYRIFARETYAAIENDRIADLLQLGIQTLLFLPLTHEEGHRSILTANNIGSISKPYFNQYGAAYVVGVRDFELKVLRDNNLPEFIRLHSAGLESDFMLTKRIETVAAFKLEDYKNLKWEYLMRKLGILQYYVTGLFKFDINIEEEDDELKRDIVGYDTYGAARHLHRPEMDFYRYTNYADLSKEEIRFVNRMGYRSLLNVINPLVLGIPGIRVSENTSFNFGLGYTMAPFGDFIDEQIWIKHKDFNFSFYARHFQNKNNWFHGFGIGVHSYQITPRLFTNANIHFWQQPRKLDFYTSEITNGRAIDLDFKYFINLKNSSKLKAYSIDFGFMAKTKGFLPEEVVIGKHFGLRFGASIKI